MIGASGAVGRAVCAQILATGLLHPNERLQLVGRRGGASETGVFGLRIDLLDAYADRAPEVEPILDAAEIDADVILMVAGQTPTHDPRVASSRDAVATANLAVFEEYAVSIAEHSTATRSSSSRPTRWSSRSTCSAATSSGTASWARAPTTTRCASGADRRGHP